MFRPAAVTLTDRAVLKLTTILKNNNCKDALFYVQGGGCNGLKYVLEPMKQSPHKFDEAVALNKDHNLWVCGTSMMHLLGTKIDWSEDFMGQSFRFTNPNVANTCGCGATFSPKE